MFFISISIKIFYQTVCSPHSTNKVATKYPFSILSYKITSRKVCFKLIYVKPQIKMSLTARKSIHLIVWHCAQVKRWFNLIIAGRGRSRYMLRTNGIPVYLYVIAVTSTRVVWVIKITHKIFILYVFLLIARYKMYEVVNFIWSISSSRYSCGRLP